MTDVKDRFDLALDTLVRKVQRDPCVLAAVLLGSLSHDTVWQRSDIDLLLVVEETKHKRQGLCLVEEGVNIHAMIVTRSEFRKMLEGSVQGSFMHSMLAKGRLIFSKDEPLADLFEQRQSLADTDRAIQILQRVQMGLAGLAKAEKWLQVRRDADYCTYWVLKIVDSLASVEVLLNGDVPAREVVQQALAYNPEFFTAIYTKLLHHEADVRDVLDRIDAYLKDNVDTLFAPIFAYLAEEDAVRSMTDIDHHFKTHFNLDGVDLACEWLADEGYLHKLALPARLTRNSRVDVEEAAYATKGD